MAFLAFLFRFAAMPFLAVRSPSKRLLTISRDALAVIGKPLRTVFIAVAINIVYFSAIAVVSGVQSDDDLLAPYREAAKSWETEIQKLEQADQTERADAETILFLGSSSIRLWDSIAEDLPKRKTMRRAYGGARFSDIAVYIDRLIAVHRPLAIVLFAANDVSGDSDRDIPPEKAVELANYNLNRIRNKFPDVPIFILAITPTPSRFAVWPEIERINIGLEKISRSYHHCYFLATAEHFLDAQGQPRENLFLVDRLHLNHDGYHIWAELLERSFQDNLPLGK